MLFECLETRRLLSASPIILSEFLANNKTGIVDSAGNTSGWVEVQNTSSTQAVNLQNWQLVYNQSATTTYTFPSVTLGPCESRVIFCDSSIPASYDPVQELNTGFKLSKSSKNLKLLDNTGNVITAYTPYPVQNSDVSYGIGETVSETDLVAAGATATYYVPTDGTTYTNTGAGRRTGLCRPSTIPPGPPGPRALATAKSPVLRPRCTRRKTPSPWPAWRRPRR